MHKRALFVLGLLLGLARPVQAQPCNFKGYSTLEMSEFVEFGTTKKVTPTYPEEAKTLGGLIYVRVLINEKGRVEKACVDPKLSSSSKAILGGPALSAAKKCTFVPNFGFPTVPKPWKGKYLETVLVFNFQPKRKEQAKESDKKNSATQR